MTKTWLKATLTVQTTTELDEQLRNWTNNVSKPLTQSPKTQLTNNLPLLARSSKS